MNPLAIDLFCGLGGWTDGLLAEGYDVIGFDNMRHVYGEHRYPAQLVLQDVLTLHGSQFKDAALIVASPPCQEYSYMAMPWTLAKAKATAIRADTTGAELERLNRLFNTCFRIQREACEAVGRTVPLIVENVKGAEPWVGRARWNFGSFHLWGDVPALMPSTLRATKNGSDGGSWFPQGNGATIEGNHGRDGRKVAGLDWSKYGQPGYKGEGFNTHADRRLRAQEGQKVPGFRFDGSGHSFQSASVNTHGRNRKFASAMIAKIPMQLSRHIASTFRPHSENDRA